jgi:8-oxo-dGTP pyrophosphatase MutT (NUDIX family)
MPVRQFIRNALSGSSVPDDLVKTAADRVDAALLAAWFKMPLRQAAVLVPLTERGGAMQMLLTERTHTVSDHPGQVSFPGGTAEPEDPDLLTTALREAHEEIGMRPEQVEVVGYLPAQAVISGYAVLPVVGFYDADFSATIDPREVASVFEVPLAFLRDTDNLVRVDREKNGVMLPTYEYHYDGHMVWGATALMIRQFIAMLD